MVEEKDKPEASNPQENEASAEEKQPEVEPVPVLKDMVILPPLQKGASGADSIQDGVPLPPIRAEEPVSSIRAALSEVVGYAHLTSYRFVLEDKPKSKPSGNSEPPIVSKYTGSDAVVSVPVAVKSLETEPQGTEKIPTSPPLLDDYGDLTPLLNSGLEDGSAFRIVLERYDVALIRDHITRLKSLLEGNAPSAFSLDEGAEKAA